MDLMKGGQKKTRDRSDSVRRTGVKRFCVFSVLKVTKSIRSVCLNYMYICLCIYMYMWVCNIKHMYL